MKKRRRIKNGCAIGLAMSFFFAGVLPLHGQEDYSNEAEWYKKCSQVQTTQAGVDACVGFQEYQQEKKEILSKNIKDFNSNIEALTKDTEEMESLAEEQKQIADELSEKIKVQEEAIEKLQKSIDEVEVQIQDKQKEIDRWDEQIKKRMKQEQAPTGTNQLIDVIMGSKGLGDLLRRITGLERITASDQDQIKTINKMKEELVFSQNEIKRLQKDHTAQKEELVITKQQAEALQVSYQKLVDEYTQKKAELEAKKREAQTDLNSIKDFVISADLSRNLDFSQVPVVDGFINPVPAGITSAGTWQYPGGGLHLGVDKAAPIGSDLVAPASGVVIFTSNGQPSNSGYLGNWSGYPAGSGNCIIMLCPIDGTLYAVSFAHLSNTFFVSPGQVVAQGHRLAMTGNSGNSSGAHTHIEVYNLGSLSVETALDQFRASGDTAFGTGWGSTSTACEATGRAPCRERPEKFF